MPAPKVIEIANDGKSPAQILVDCLNNNDSLGDTADELGWSPSTLYRYMRRFNIQTRYVLETKNAQGQGKNTA